MQGLSPYSLAQVKELKVTRLLFYSAIYMLYETKLYFYVVFWSMDRIAGGTILHLHKLVWMRKIMSKVYCIVFPNM